jgi:hypothetical protein
MAVKNRLAIRDHGIARQGHQFDAFLVLIDEMDKGNSAGGENLGTSGPYCKKSV